MTHSSRICVDLSQDWSFVKGWPGRAWLRGHRGDGERMDLPHCWNTTDTFQLGVRYYQGWGGYRRLFVVPPEAESDERRVWRLESEGFYGTGEAWLNGKRLARLDGQYLGFQLDPEPLLRRRVPNLLVVAITNRCSRSVLPGHRCPDFLLHGGLTDRVRLVGLPRVHIVSSEVRIETVTIAGSEAQVRFEWRVRNASDTVRRTTAQWEIRNVEEALVAQGPPRELAVPGQTQTRGFTETLTVSPVELWSPEHPYLYEARCRLAGADGVLDEHREKFGIRWAEFRPGEGSFLNGPRIEPRGVNRHECMPGFGSALPLALHREDGS